jgi:hypothetical protein
MDLRGEETRALLGEESFKLLGAWLDTCDQETLRAACSMEGILNYAIKDEEGVEIAELEASPRTMATIIYLLEKAGEREREKVAKWMTEYGFATGHGDTLDDLLKELSWQVKELRTELASLQTELEDESV